MPRPGYRSLTIREEVYTYLWNEYINSKKEWLMKNGITSFNGYVTFRLCQLVEIDSQRTGQQTNSAVKP